MKRYANLCALSLLMLAAAFFAGALNSRAFADEQQPKAVPAAQVQESENTDYSEDEYNAYDAAKKESDPEKKSAILLDFLQKYPKTTTIIPSINFEYTQLLDDLSAAKKWELLELLAEKWLKIRPNDVKTIGHIADATCYQKKYDRCAECLEELYRGQPSPTLAKSLFRTYQSTNNLAKQIEWSEKLFKMQEFEADYNLRWEYVRKYMESNNIPKAAEYAQLTLKSADLVKQPSPEIQQELKKIRHACYHVIGVNLFEKGKYPEAIEEFNKAIKIERYSDGYYFIGRCIDIQNTAKSQDKAEEAMNAYAKAELLGGDNASKAKERIKQIYPALHSGSDIGMDKVYRRAKEELGIK